MVRRVGVAVEDGRGAAAARPSRPPPPWVQGSPESGDDDDVTDASPTSCRAWEA